MLEQERQRIEQLTAGWDDPTQIDWGAEEQQASDQAKLSVEGGAPTLVYKCVALYSYTVRKLISFLKALTKTQFQAQNPDELSMVESEQLEVVGEGDGDGWLRARNNRGEEGFVPHNYLDVDRSLAGAQGKNLHHTLAWLLDRLQRPYLYFTGFVIDLGTLSKWTRNPRVKFCAQAFRVVHQIVSSGAINCLFWGFTLGRRKLVVPRYPAGPLHPHFQVSCPPVVVLYAQRMDCSR